MHASTWNVARAYTGSETRAIDQRAINEFSIPGIRLMHRAGRAAFDVLRSRWPDARSVSVVCGSGNNAGDGYVIAGLARDAGFGVQLIQVADPANLTGDALQAFRFAECRLGSIERSPEDWRIGGEVVVDALLGTGAKGEVRPYFQLAIDRINASAKPVLAVDVPSGVNADSGGLLAANPVRADLTVTFVAAKLGLLTGPGVDYAGEIAGADLGVPARAYGSAGIRVLDGRELPQLKRRRNSHKGDFGRLLIVGGDSDMGGAVLLAGEAALRVGAGLVNVATRAVHRAALLARRPELMVRGTQTPADIGALAEHADAIAVGPGLGTESWGSGLLEFCAAAGKPLVVDADGLNVLARADALRSLPCGAIVTPHPGEAGRLLGKDSAWVQSHRPQAAAALSEHGATVVLKGAGTLIGAQGKVASICLAGNPGMATAGSGDVLTGIVGTLLARGLPPLAAAELGVWLHARAGDEAQESCPAALMASDIVAALRLTA